VLHDDLLAERVRRGRALAAARREAECEDGVVLASGEIVQNR